MQRQSRDEPPRRAASAAQRGVAEAAGTGQLDGDPGSAGIRGERERDVRQRGDGECCGEDLAGVARYGDGDEGETGAVDRAADEMIEAHLSVRGES